MEEDELPQMKPRGQRAGVMSAKFEVPANWKPPVNPKARATLSRFGVPFGPHEKARLSSLLLLVLPTLLRLRLHCRMRLLKPS